MKVLKFGGTSVGSASRIKEVAKLITDGEQKIVVLSAMSGTTNTLVEISDYLYKKNPEGANEIINKLEAKYKQHVNELYSTPEYKQKGQELIKSHFDYIRSYTKDLFTLFEEKVVLAQGELISTAMMNYYLQECGVKSILLPALEYMRTDKNAEPDPVYIKEKLQMQLELHPGAEIYITQGYICRNAYGEIDNLQRGGSDYTASLIGAAINASEIQIWTDIDGMHNNEEGFYERLESYINAILFANNITGFCYTQFTDIEQEKNGIYYYDRRPKLNMERIKAIFEKIPSRPQKEKKE